MLHKLPKAQPMNSCPEPELVLQFQSPTKSTQPQKYTNPRMGGTPQLYNTLDFLRFIVLHKFMLTGEQKFKNYLTLFLTFYFHSEINYIVSGI